jgi:hypothetical protein
MTGGFGDPLAAAATAAAATAPLLPVASICCRMCWNIVAQSGCADLTCSSSDSADGHSSLQRLHATAAFHVHPPPPAPGCCCFGCCPLDVGGLPTDGSLLRGVVGGLVDNLGRGGTAGCDFLMLRSSSPLWPVFSPLLLSTSRRPSPPNPPPTPPPPKSFCANCGSCSGSRMAAP